MVDLASVEQMSLVEVMGALTERGVDFTGCFDKTLLLQSLVEAIEAEQRPTLAPPPVLSSKEELLDALLDGARPQPSDLLVIGNAHQRRRMEEALGRALRMEEEPEPVCVHACVCHSHFPLPPNSSHNTEKSSYQQESEPLELPSAGLDLISPPGLGEHEQLTVSNGLRVVSRSVMGQTIWPSATVLADVIGDFLAAASHEGREGVRGLEIGAGAGLPALAAARSGYEVVATDFDDDVIEIIRVNAQLNGLLEAAPPTHGRPPLLSPSRPLSVFLPPLLSLSRLARAL